MAAADSGVLVRTSEPPRLRVRERLRELYASREILLNLVRKELKVKYSGSALGVAWSMLNPLLYLAVFYVVFTFFLRSGIEDFALFLFSGLVAWTLFSSAVGVATVSVVGNANLVSKVAFPREILPLATVGASLVNFGFQVAVLLGFIGVFELLGHHHFGWHILLLPLALVVLLVFTTAVALFVAAMNVRYRDTQYLVELGLLAWFWMTPIVYAAGFIRAQLSGGVFFAYMLNPIANIVLAFQRALYGAGTAAEEGGRFAEAGEAILPEPGIAWYVLRLGVVGVASLALLYVAWRLFFNRSGDFAEEL